MAKKIILYIILIILGVSSTSCQTIQGIGSDIQWTAKKSAEAYGGEKTKAGNEEPQTWEGKKVKPEVEEDRY